ncbi:hypothetical protein [Mucilaginibacter gossypii]|uniref:hypothetical protein n=1 Tax=Mucilaginibacter gossypii TaxID=551996 RepID=UPI00210E2947|nr:hypothetical protein [Mucilaginibacter gossypii]
MTHLYNIADKHDTTIDHKNGFLYNRFVSIKFKNNIGYAVEKKKDQRNSRGI